jgi:TonB family protein
MWQFLIAACVAAVALSAARAQDEPLPDSVARAYLAYESALLAQDNEAATDAAGTAWRAARDERIDAELIGILAENYGNLALSRGEHELAYHAWRNAAEISDRLRAPESERALRWYRASLSAFATGEIYDARQCSLRSSRAAAAADTPIDAGLSGDIHYMIAATSGQLGRLNTMAEHAVLAVEAFRLSGRPYDLVYGNAHYLSGVGRYFEADRTGSILDFAMARGIYATTEAADQARNIRTSSLWVYLARSEASPEELAQIDAQIAASDFPDTDFSDIWGDEEADAAAYDVDAVAGYRREPNYPLGAAQADLDGIVLVQFAVTEEGRTDAAEIIAAAPTGVFDDAVLRAMRSWRYEPAMIDGQPVRRERVLTRFMFTMCRSQSPSACRREQEARAAPED